MPSLKAVLVDLDDTLYEYAQCNDYATKKAVAYAAKRLGISGKKALLLFSRSKAGVKKLAGKTAASHSRLLYFKRLAELALGKTDNGLALELERRFWREYFSKMRLRKSSKKFLGECRKRKIGTAIVTNLTTKIQLRKLKRLGLEKHFDFVITSEEVGIEKPDPKPIKVALERLKARKNEAMFIGDEEDRTAARKAGVRFFEVRNDSDWKATTRKLFTNR